MSDLSRLLPAFALRRPVTTLMAGLALLVLSVIAWRDIRLELIPSGFTPPFLFVQVPTLPGAPADLEQAVAIPIEEELATVRGLATLQTTVTTSTVTYLLELRDGTDMDSAYNQVRERVERGMARVDQDVGLWFVWKYNPADDPLSWFGITAPVGTGRPDIAIRERLIPTLERIPGVSRVDVFGLPDDQVVIELEAWRARAVPGGALGLLQHVRDSHLAVAAGELEGAAGATPVRVVSRLESLEDLRSLPVPGTGQLGGIATVSVQDASSEYVYRINERPGIFVAVYKESTANVVDLSRRVRAELDAALVGDPELGGFGYHFFFDQGQMIRQSLGQLQRSAVWGGLLAVLVLFLFLRRPGVTALVATSIPACLLITVAVLHATGRSLNVLSLTGMMLSVGLVVDNAIVVVEAVQRRAALGASRWNAALEGTAEVALPVTVATLTTVVVFLPLTLMTGSRTFSFYLGAIGFPVCVALLASLLVSLVFIPLLALHTLSPPSPEATRADSTPPDALPPAPDPREHRAGDDERAGVAAAPAHDPLAGVATAPEPPPSWIERRYERLLRLALRRPADATLIALLLFASIAWPMQHIVRTDQTEANINDVRISLDFDPALTWEERVERLERYERVLLDHRDELEIRDLRIGLGSIGLGDSEIRAFLLEPEERQLSRPEITARLSALLPEVAGVQHRLGVGGMNPGSDGATTVSIVGPDSGVLAELSRDVAVRLRRIPGVESVQPRQRDADSDELRLNYQRDVGAALGTTGLSLGATVDYAVRGREATRMKLDGRRLPVIVRGAELESVVELGELAVPGAAPGVTVSGLVTTERTAATRSITRQGRRTVLELELVITRADLDVLSSEIDAALADVAFPRGYGVEKGERFALLAEGARERTFALTLAVIFVFLLVGILFESFALPFVVLFSVPFAFTGVFWALYLTNTSLDVMGGVGLLVLVGIVVNNAIVLVDLARERERAGSPRTEALVEAGVRRLRPILMTALTTIIGLVPMALGRSTLIGIPYAPLGRAVIGGMIASTLLTLVVVPLFYALIDDGRRFTRRALGTGGRDAG